MREEEEVEQEATKIGVVVDRIAEDLSMEISQIPHFALMTDGRSRSRTSVSFPTIMVANGRRTEAETQEVTKNNPGQTTAPLDDDMTLNCK